MVGRPLLLGVLTFLAAAGCSACHTEGRGKSEEGGAAGPPTATAGGDGASQSADGGEGEAHAAEGVGDQGEGAALGGADGGSDGVGAEGDPDIPHSGEGEGEGEAPPMPDPELISGRLAQEMGVCERYLQPAIDSAARRSGFDARWVGGFDDRWVAFVSVGTGRAGLWTLDLTNGAWQWLGSGWGRVAYGDLRVFAATYVSDDPTPAETTIRFAEWDVSTGAKSMLELSADLAVGDLAVGDGFWAFVDARPGGNFGTVGWANVVDRATGEALEWGPGMLAMAAEGPVATWVRSEPSPYDLWVYDHRTGQARQATEDAAWQFHPRTDGRTVVFGDSRNGEYVPHGEQTNLDVYRLDVASGEVAQVTTHAANQSFPDVDGDLVVYEDERAGMWLHPEWNRRIVNKDIWLTNVRTGREFQLTFHPHQQYEPRIHGRFVLFKDIRFDTGTGTPGLTLLDLDCHEREFGLDIDD